MTGRLSILPQIFFNQAVAEGMVKTFEDSQGKQACVVKRLKPVMNGVAQGYVEQTFTKKEQRLLDELFGTPLGQAMYGEIKSGNIKEFGRSLNPAQYNQSDYEKYFTVMEKYFNGIQDSVPGLFNDEVKNEMLIAAIKCEGM